MFEQALQIFEAAERRFEAWDIKMADRWRELYQQWGCTYRSRALARQRRHPDDPAVAGDFSRGHELLEKALAWARKGSLPGVTTMDVHEDLAVIRINQDEYDQRVLGHLEDAEACAPDEYKIRAELGLVDVPQAIRGYWRELGQCQLQRMLYSFGAYDFGMFQWHDEHTPRTPVEAKGQAQYLATAAEHLLLMLAYLTRYARFSSMLEKAESLALRELTLDRTGEQLDELERALLKAARDYNLLSSEALGRALDLISRARRDVDIRVSRPHPVNP
jgi:hypothetical protein